MSGFRPTRCRLRPTHVWFRPSPCLASSHPCPASSHPCPASSGPPNPSREFVSTFLAVLSTFATASSMFASGEDGFHESRLRGFNGSRLSLAELRKCFSRRGELLAEATSQAQVRRTKNTPGLQLLCLLVCFVRGVLVPVAAAASGSAVSVQDTHYRLLRGRHVSIRVARRIDER